MNSDVTIAVLLPSRLPRCRDICPRGFGKREFFFHAGGEGQAPAASSPDTWGRAPLGPPAGRPGPAPRRATSAVRDHSGRALRPFGGRARTTTWAHVLGEERSRELAVQAPPGPSSEYQ